MDFHKNVFVNCPFDEEYRELLLSLLFTIAYLGFKPRIALEDLDSGVPRIEKIASLIRDSRYAIHDLSRMQARGEGEFYRLNMRNQARLRGPGPERVWTDFLQFMSENYDALEKRGYSGSDIECLPIGELLDHMDAWIARNRSAD